MNLAFYNRSQPIGPYGSLKTRLFFEPNPRLTLGLLTQIPWVDGGAAAP